MTFLNSVMELGQSTSNSIPENEKYIDALQKREDEIIKQIESLGYEDPRLDPDQSASLKVGDYRFFIKGFEVVDIDDIEESNIRSQPLDKKWAENDLVEMFKANQREQGGGPGIRFLPLCREHSSLPRKKKTYTGHHRVWAQHVFRADGKVAVLIITAPVKVKDEDSFSTKPEQACILSKIRSNPRMSSLQMTRKCAKIALQDLFDEDPTFGGRNPSGEKPPRSSEECFDFDDLMDWIWKPSQNFLSKSSRTAIYNQWIHGGPVSKLLDTSNEANITAFLAQSGLEPGLNKNGNRVPFLKHFDLKNNSLIIPVDDNGNNFYGKVAKFLVEWISNPEYRSLLSRTNIKYISVVARVYDPPVALKRIKARRAAFLGQVKLINELVKRSTLGAFEINLLTMPPELKNDKDEGLTWEA